MNKYAKEWIKALRSGKYEQNRDALLCDLPDEGPARFCCLGVAEDLFNEVMVSHHEGTGFCCVFKGGDDGETLTPATQKLLRLYGAYGEPSKTGRLTGYRSLTFLNDHRGLTFKQIANHLEKYEAEYFIQEEKA